MTTFYEYVYTDEIELMRTIPPAGDINP
jgi:hypothetical protein